MEGIGVRNLIFQKPDTFHEDVFNDLIFLNTVKENKKECGLMIERSLNSQQRLYEVTAGLCEHQHAAVLHSPVCLSVFLSYAFLFPARASRNRKRNEAGNPSPTSPVVFPSSESP